ncbi:MAG: hypothetical protein WBL61_17190 [Bryobacteraceae bacterium]
MERRLEFELQKSLDPDLLNRVDEVFHGENLLQMILHAHLLIERGMSAQIATKLARPEIVRELKNFSTKLNLYLGLFNPPKPQETILFDLGVLKSVRQAGA